MHGAHQQIHHDFVLNISGRKSKISDWGPRISDTRSKIPDNNWLITDHGSRVLICDTFQLHNEILSWPWSSNPYRIALSPNADRAIDAVLYLRRYRHRTTDLGRGSCSHHNRSHVRPSFEIQTYSYDRVYMNYAIGCESWVSLLWSSPRIVFLSILTHYHHIPIRGE